MVIYFYVFKDIYNKINCQMILTEKELNEAKNKDMDAILKDIVECSELYFKGQKLLSENKISKSEVDSINEGLWEKVKYGLSKLGRYKVGGKLTGRGKVDQDTAAKIQSILDKKGNEVIKILNSKIKEENPEFPNNEKGEQFLKTVMEIATVYDSIVEATKKNPEEEGYLPIDAANTVIEDLAEYVKKYLDVDLKAVYSVMDSEKEKVDSKEELLTDEVDDIKEDEHSDVRDKLQAKKGEGDIKRDSERMKTLKSNKLPLLLAGVGASMGAFSWLANTEWFKHLFDENFSFTDTEQIKDIIQTKTEVLNDIKPGEGVYKLLGRVTEHNLDGNSSPSEMVEALKQIGGGDANKGVDLLCQDGGVMMKPGEAAKGLHDLVNNPDQYNNLGDMFKGTASGTGKLVEPGTGLNTTSYGTIAGRSLTSMLIKSLPTIITKVVIKTGVKTGAGYAVAKGFGAALGPIGIALVSAGALVKVMRVKGQKQSRAKTLNDLFQSIQPIKGTQENIPVLPPKPESEDIKGGEGNEGGDTNKGDENIVGKNKNICNAKNLNELNKLLEDTKTSSQNLKVISKYQDDSDFQKIFLDAFINTTKSIKINQKPLLKTLTDLKNNGLLEAPTSMSGRQRKYLKIKLDLQNFMVSLMKLFSATYKSCKKTSKTFQLIKNFFKQLFNIASQGKSNSANEQARKQLWKKLIGTFSNFLNSLNKLPKMEKGKLEKPTEDLSKKSKEGRGGNIKGGTFSGSAPRTAPPQLAHHDKGDNYLNEEISKMKDLMKRIIK